MNRAPLAPAGREQRAAHLALLVIGGAGISGWLLRWDAPLRIIPDGTPMVFNSAIAFTALGVGFLLRARVPKLAAVLGIAVAALGACVFAQFPLGRSIGIDQLFLRQDWIPTLSPAGQMAANTAAAFVASGVALALLAARRPPRAVVAVLGAPVLAAAALALASYVFQLRTTFSWGRFTGMALPTALGFLLTSFALLRGVLAGQLPEAAHALRTLAFYTATGVTVCMVAAATIVAQLNPAEESSSEIIRLVLFGNGLGLLFFTTATMLATRAERRRAVAEGELAAALSSLRLNEEQFRRAFDDAGIGMALVDLGGRWLRVNRALCEIVGYSATELHAKTFQQITHPDDLESDLDRMRELLSGARASYQMEKRYLHRDGRIVWVRLTGSVVRDTSGRPLHFIKQIEDITAQRGFERALRESEERARLALEAAGIGIWEWHVDSGVIVWDVRMFEIYGLSPPPDRRVDYATWRSAVHPADLAEQERLLTATVAARGRGRREFRIRRRSDARLRTIVAEEIVRQDEADGHLRVVGVNRDITEERALQLALRESESRLRLFAERAPAAVAMFDCDMRYLVASAKWLSDYGLAGEDIIGRSHYEVFPDIPDRWRAIHQRCLAGAVEHCDADPFDRANGERMWLRWEVRPWHQDDGTVGGIVMFTADITEQKRLENELAAARDRALETSRLKSEFLASMSHEIRTPMNAILGMTSLLAGTRLNAEQKEMTRVVLGGTENLLAIINDILDFSKIEAGKLRLAPAPFELAVEVRETVALLAPRARAKPIDLTLEAEPEPAGRRVGDAGRLRQVLTNLLGNAIKFTERGRIVVRIARREPPLVRFEVVDTGPGIPLAVQPRIFEAFMQADARQHHGTGLGLAISRQLVELMGGRIGFQSEPGNGSTFWFELPLPLATEVPSAEPAPARAPVTNVSGQGRTVLVAEDNAANQAVATLMLQKFGFDAVVAANGTLALELLAARRIDAVLMDCQMPVLDGYETTRRIRAGAAPSIDPRVPIIGLTAYARPEDRARCLEAGMDDMLPKPIHPDDLAGALCRHGLAIASTLPAAPSAPPDTPPAETMVDPAALEVLRRFTTKHGGTLLDEAVALFQRELPEILAQSTARAAEHDGAGLAQIVHRLAGSCANFGARPLRAAALALEASAHRGDWRAVAAGLASLQLAAERTRVALDAAVGGSPRAPL